MMLLGKSTGEPSVEKEKKVLKLGGCFWEHLSSLFQMALSLPVQFYSPSRRPSTSADVFPS